MNGVSLPQSVIPPRTESSARDAMVDNIRVLMVSDANAAMTRGEHDAALIGLYLSFTDLMETDMIVDRLSRADTRTAA